MTKIENMEAMPPAPSTWPLKDFSRLATATSSQSPLGHDSRRRHPPSSDLKVPIYPHVVTLPKLWMQKNLPRFHAENSELL